MVHILNEDPFIAEIESMPDPRDQYVTLTNLRKRDGKDLHYITRGAQVVLFPWSRINFLEIMQSDEQRRQVIDFYRET